MRKLNVFVKRISRSNAIKQDALSNSRTSSVRTSYSIDSANQLLPKHISPINSNKKLDLEYYNIINDNIKYHYSSHQKPIPDYV